MAATAAKPSPPLPRRLIEEAHRLQVDVAGRTEEDVRKDVRAAWMDENRNAIEASNAWVEKHGLPLAKYRQF